MARISDFNVDDYSVLLAGDKIDASKGVLFGGAGDGMIPPDTHNRTILIGMGGTGIKTINHIKGSIDRKLSPNWRQYIAFLGIDADWTEFEKAGHLTNAECVLTRCPGFPERAQNEDRFPAAWHTFADHDRVSHLGIGGGSLLRYRLVAKMKIHDKQEGSRGVDEQIVEKLISLKGNTLAPTSGNQSYEVYVIGSVCGGTCSGGFIEMPALIRKALGGGSDVRIHAMLYLPDMFTGLDPACKDELEANGYASLKELNYYQGLNMRKGYSESFSCNDPAAPELKLGDQQGFFDMPYLIGTARGADIDSLRIAMETVAEFFVSILSNTSSDYEYTCSMMDAFSHASLRAGCKETHFANPQVEAPGELHEFPKCYGALGFAAARAPEKVLRAYLVARACKAAGIKPVDAQTRAEMIAGGADRLPFMGEDDYLLASDGTREAEAILQPLLDFVAAYQKKQFDFQTNMGVNVTWEEIRNGAYDNHNFEVLIENYTRSMTDTAATSHLDQDVQRAFAQFRENAKAYVAEYGPIAFYNLYKGHFIPENNNPGVGIAEMISRIRNDRDPRNGAQRSWKSAVDARTEITNAKDEIVRTSLIRAALFGKKPEQVNNWLSAKNAYVTLCVNEKRREYVLGNNKAIFRLFERPAAVLADQLETFGNILECLTDIYETHGRKLTDFTQFAHTADSATEVNIAALEPAAYAWLLDYADNTAASINGWQIRNNLVESFFEDPSKWLDVYDEMLRCNGWGIMLENPDVAVPARQMFDAIMSETIGVNTTISIEKLFVEVDQRHVDYDHYAKRIVEELARQSQALFDGNLDANMFHHYIMYPQALNNTNPAIVMAIQQAAWNMFPGILCYSSAYADSIMMYQLAAPFEIYRLNALANWEKQYEVKMSSINGLHGRSPDLKKTVDAAGFTHYSEMTSWYDYPAITYAQDPTKPDPNTGVLSHEGEVRLEIDKLLDEARTLGVLYSKQENGKWAFYRVHCDDSRKWKLEIGMLRPDEKTGLYPVGEELVKAIAAQNGSSVDAMSRAVQLHNGGLMNQPHTTEDWAWYYAKRVLYAHRPMLIEIRETVKQVREWNRKVVKGNDDINKEWWPAKMIRMMQGHVLFPDAEGYWMLEGSHRAVANLSDAGRMKLHLFDPVGKALVDNGFVLYYIYRSLNRRKDMECGGMDEVFARARAKIEAWEDNELLTACFERTERMLNEETQKLIDLGANLDEPEKKPTRKFVEKMSDLGIDLDLVELCEFYQRAGAWPKIL